MARIYISYSQRDADLAKDLAIELRSRGHELAIDLSVLTPGVEWRDALTTALQNADALVALITRHALESQFVVSEIGAARAFAQSRGEMLVIPVIADEMSIPSFISDIHSIVAIDRDVKRIAEEVDRALISIIGSRAARQQQQVAEKAQLEKDAAPFVDEAIASLTKNEKRDRLTAYVWFIVGALALLVGLVYGFWAFTAVPTVAPKTAVDVPSAWIAFAWAALKTFVIVGLLLAGSKYCFVLGKAHMSEALKSADRIHAISYGRFYLRAWGGREAPPQIKEVFQQWNISAPSAFAAAAPDQYDPKYLERLVDIAKLLTPKGDSK